MNVAISGFQCQCFQIGTYWWTHQVPLDETIVTRVVLVMLYGSKTRKIGPLERRVLFTSDGGEKKGSGGESSQDVLFHV